MSAEDQDHDDSEHRKTMFAHFGAAIYLSNCFEHGLAIALMFADFMSAQTRIIKTEGQAFDHSKYETEYDTFFDRQFAQTMGNLVRRLEKVFPVPDSLSSKMS